MVVFYEGEVNPAHDELTDRRLRELFGATSFEEGYLLPALREMLEESPPAWREGLKDFSHKVAATLAHHVVHSGWMSHDLPSVNLVVDTVFFDGNSQRCELAPTRQPRIVVDYGPGIGERFILGEHFLACKAGRPFYYTPVTRSSFPNSFAVYY